MIRDISRNLKVRSLLSHGQKIDASTGDQVSFVDTHEIQVTADEIMLQDNGGAPYRAAMIDVTVDIAASGVNGLDTGTKKAKAPGTWYHIWMISDAGGSVKGLLSESASNPVLPAGFTHKAYVGAVYNMHNNGADHLISYYQNSRLAWAEKSCPLSMDAFPNTPTSIDLSASIPSTAIAVILELSGLTAIGGNYISNINVGPTPSGPWHNRFMMVAGTPQGAGAIDHLQFVTQSEVLIDLSQQIFAFSQTQNDRLEIHVIGWRY